MRTRSRRQADRSGLLGLVMFGSIGWLFADLMTAIAMAFLVANTVGVATPPTPHVTKKTHITPRPRPHPSPTQGPALDLNYVCVLLTFDNPQSLISGDSPEVTSVRNQIISQADLTSQRAGLVLLFGGDPDSPQDDEEALSLDKAVIGILQGLGQQQDSVFSTAVYRKFVGLNQPQTTVELDVYVFKPPNGIGAPVSSDSKCPGANSSG